MTDPDTRAYGIVRVGRDTTTGSTHARASVAIGFGSNADDSGVSRLDLNNILIEHIRLRF